MNFSEWLNEEERDRLFDTLAKKQRRGPERFATDPRQQISQLYGWLMEHTGDLIHRMTEIVTSDTRGYEFVREKVINILNKVSPRLLDYILEQIENNSRYYQERGEKPPVETNFAALRKFGKEYAEAYQQLTPYNQMQRHAIEAAICLGELKLQDFASHVRAIYNVIQQGEAEWVKRANESEENT